METNKQLDGMWEVARARGGSGWSGRTPGGERVGPGDIWGETAGEMAQGTPGYRELERVEESGGGVGEGEGSRGGVGEGEGVGGGCHTHPHTHRESFSRQLCMPLVSFPEFPGSPIRQQATPHPPIIKVLLIYAEL